MPIRVAELIVYPVKSFRGVNVDRWPLEQRGLRLDRRWMVVDSEGNFLTARKVPRMAMIGVEMLSDGLRLSMNGLGACDLPLTPTGDPVEVRVWDTPVSAQRVGGSVDGWLTDALQQPCSLVYMPDETERKLQTPDAREGEILAFSDSNPILVASQASIDDLNSRLRNALPIRRFRPNIVVAGCEAFEEDTWRGLQVGSVRLRFSKKCGRCIFTTIDIETGMTGDEPLRTLSTYRKDGNHVYFGSFYVPLDCGVVGLGDPVSPLAIA